MDLKIGLRGVETLWEIGVLRHYLDSMEGQLQELSHTARAELWEQHHPDSEDSYNEFLSYLRMHDDFYDEQLRTLRFSFIVRVHTLFEIHVRSFCRALRADRAIPLEFRDLNGNSVEKAALFCTKLISLLPEDHPCWGALEELQVVRNCIVHTYGSIEGFRYAKELRTLAAKQIGIGLEDSKLVVENSFCHYALSVIHDFFKQAFSAAGWKT